MPRASTDLATTNTPKRAPRARVKKVADESVAEKPRRTRTKKVVSEAVVVEERKAPTPLARHSASIKTKQKHFIVIGILLLIGIGSSAVVGLTDKGQIDVVTIIEDRNKKAEERGEKIVATSEKDQLPDGGLIPADQGTTTPDIIETATATTTATTTESGNIPRTDEEVMADTTTIVNATSS